MEYIRQWKVGDQTFDNKEAAQKFETTNRLETIVGDRSLALRLTGHADEVIDLLKPFATPKTRKPKGNGTQVKPAGAPKTSKSTQTVIA